MSAERKPERFLWLDVETTGLDPTGDLLLEVAAWPSRSADPFDLHELDARSWVLMHHPTRLAEKLSPFTWKMHSVNGLLGDVVSSTVTLKDLLEGLINTAPPDGMVGGATMWYLAGNSVHFDRGFLNHNVPEFARRLSHRILDVTSLLLIARAAGHNIPKAEPAHRAMDDVKQSIAIARSVMVDLRGKSWGQL